MNETLRNDAWLAAPILLPLLTALIASLLPDRARVRASLAGATATFVASAAVIAGVVRGGPGRHHLGGWGAPLGIDLYADGLTALMLAMTAVLGAAISVYATGYFHTARERRCFWPLWFVLWTGLNALFLTADLFNFYVTLEVVGLSAVALVAMEGGPLALTAAARYLFVAMMGSLVYMGGVALIYSQYGVLDLTLLHGRLGVGPVGRAALALMVVGLLAKTAVFPLHLWLPPAHSSAPAPVSAALSGLVVKGSFYILLRTSFSSFADSALAAIGPFLGVLGGLAVLWGSLQALTQDRLKLMVAYSTVAQIGYLFLLFPVAMPGAGDAAWQSKAYIAGIFHALSHAAAKGAMFMAAGAILHAVGRDDKNSLRGLGEKLPVATSAFAVAGVSIMALPPSGGFIAKWMMLVAAVRTGQWWWAPLMIGGGLLAAAYIFRMVKFMFFQPPASAAELHPIPRRLEFTALALALTALALGLASVYPLAVAAIGAPFPSNWFTESF
ncbi:MAG: oxidoreductase [Kiritimatiellae bacterium]|nr:oxidoreductase [Kiritimatiellia bacterium]MDW8457785.1 proton-conducting transporter membrane subunit [Verrucomicrobiota bacterium]